MTFVITNMIINVQVEINTCWFYFRKKCRKIYQ